MTTLEDIKHKVLKEVPLSSLIGERVSLKSRGSVKVGLCPFHNEKTPSFTVYTNSYYCFGCHAYGDAISFVRQTLGLGFVEAIRYLAQKYAIDIPDLKDLNLNTQKTIQVKRLFNILSSAQNLYHQKLFSSEAKKALEYLEQRYFTVDDIKKFGFGYAPSLGHFIIIELTKLGFSKEEIVNASLATKTGEQYYDFFQNRLTIPIKDHFGRIVGFGARAIGKDDQPKYKNTKETEIFDKGSVLFGFFEAKDHIRKGQPALVVEGYMDVFRLWQKGFTGAVACMGTALRVPHLKALSNITDKVYVIFDGDEAGKKATIATLNTSLAVPSLNINVVVLPPGYDPDLFLLAHDTTKFNELLNSAVNLFEFVINAKIKNASYIQIPHIIKEEFVPWLANISDKIQRSFLINKISALSGISVKDLNSEINIFLKGKLSNNFNKQNNVLEQTNQESQLIDISPLEKEFISHLYFAYPHDVDINFIQKVILTDMTFSGIWLNLAKEFIHVLQEEQKSPHEYPLSYWTTASNSHILNFLEYLNNNKQLFSTQNRMSCFMKIYTQYEIQKKQDFIADLKHKMLQSTKEEQVQILELITKLNKDIVTLRSNLK